MKNLTLTAIAAFAVAGCGGGSPAKEVKIGRPTIEAPKQVEPPVSLDSDYKLSLYADVTPKTDEQGTEMDSPTIQLGDSSDDVDKIFTSPTGSYTFKDLPPGFEKGYTSKGYENSKESFGAIFFDNELALAMIRRENVDPALISDVVDKYSKANPPKRTIDRQEPPTEFLSVMGESIQYWFWEKDGQRLMICSAPDPKSSKTRDLTIAMGDQNPMNALRMGLVYAQNDRQAIEKAAKQK